MKTSDSAKPTVGSAAPFAFSRKGDLEAEATAAHFERLRAGRIEMAEAGALHLDIVRDLKRVNAHLVAAAAYPVLEGKGELLPSRLHRADRDEDATGPASNDA